MTARRISRNVQQRPSPIVAPELIGSEAGWRPEICSLPCRPWCASRDEWFRFVSVSLVGRAAGQGGRDGIGWDGVVPLRR
jgi:hypothetical protein